MIVLALQLLALNELHEYIKEPSVNNKLKIIVVDQHRLYDREQDGQLGL
jgi:hypothetical protein